MCNDWEIEGGEAERERDIYIYNLAQIITSQHIAVKLLSGPSLAISKVIIWAKFVFLNTVCKQTL